MSRRMGQHPRPFRQLTLGETIRRRMNVGRKSNLISSVRRPPTYRGRRMVGRPDHKRSVGTCLDMQTVVSTLGDLPFPWVALSGPMESHAPSGHLTTKLSGLECTRCCRQSPGSESGMLPVRTMPSTYRPMRTNPAGVWSRQCRRRASSALRPPPSCCTHQPT